MCGGPCHGQCAVQHAGVAAAAGAVLESWALVETTKQLRGEQESASKQDQERLCFSTTTFGCVVGLQQHWQVVHEAVGCCLPDSGSGGNRPQTGLKTAANRKNMNDGCPWCCGNTLRDHGYTPWHQSRFPNWTRKRTSAIRQPMRGNGTSRMQCIIDGLCTRPSPHGIGSPGDLLACFWWSGGNRPRNSQESGKNA